MRAFFLSFLFLFSVMMGSAHARNGETGILIVINEFEIDIDDSNLEVILICEDDWHRVVKILDLGHEPHLYFPNYGIYSVEKDDDGSLQVHRAEQNIGLKFHSCPVQQPHHC